MQVQASGWDGANSALCKHSDWVGGGQEASYRKVQDIGQLSQAIEDQSDEREGDVGAKDAKGRDGGKVAKKLLLLY